MDAPYRAHFLRRAEEFDAVFARGRRFFVEGLMLVTAPGSQANPRLGVMVNRKRGKAHDRNAFRRRAKEWFYRRRDALRPQTDTVLVATQSVKEQPRAVLYLQLEALFRKGGLLKDE